MTTDEAAASPAWARGYEVAALKRLTALFARHDEGMVHGAFGRYSELDAAADLAAGHVQAWPSLEEPRGAIVSRVVERRTPIKDFTGTRRLTLEPGRRYVTRMAWEPSPWEYSFAHEVLASCSEPLAVAAWQEHAAERAMLRRLGLQCAAVKITAASEMRGVYVAEELPPIERADTAGIAVLPIHPPFEWRQQAAADFTGAHFADHYSGYNKGRSWSALALRGFFDDPNRIEKPAEMNKRWKAEHPGDLDARVRWTELADASAAVRRLLYLLPVQAFERVRLMNLAPGGGELTRHADIIDPDAGATVGKVARLHIPLVTNPDCVFQSWDLDGRAVACHMAPGSVYYLDTRKPHTAVNAGSVPRLHLVADCWVTPQLQDLIAARA